MKKTTWMLMGLMLVAATAAIALDDEAELIFGEDGSETVEVDMVQNGIKVTGDIEIDEFFDSPVIIAGLTVENTNATNKVVALHVAFFDADGNLLAASSQTSFDDAGMAPGESTQFGSLIAYVPEAVAATATSFQITVYALDPTE
jgi:hypothetical protein